MEIDLEKKGLDSVNYNLTIQSILKSSNLTNQSISDSLFKSFNLFYLQTCIYKNYQNSQNYELKEKAFSIFVKQIIKKLHSADNISKETSSNSSKNSSDSHKESVRNLLELLSCQPNFFVEVVKSFNFLVLEVIFLNLYERTFIILRIYLFYAAETCMVSAKSLMR